MLTVRLIVFSSASAVRVGDKLRSVSGSGTSTLKKPRSLSSSCYSPTLLVSSLFTLFLLLFAVLCMTIMFERLMASGATGEELLMSLWGSVVCDYSFWLDHGSPHLAPVLSEIFAKNFFCLIGFRGVAGVSSMFLWFLLLLLLRATPTGYLL